MTLKEKVVKSKEIIKEAAKRYPHEKLALAWTGGKDSTVLLHLVRDTFGKVPFPVVFNDSTMEFPEIYEFIDKLTQEWNLNLVRVSHSKDALAKFHRTKDYEEKRKLSRLMKIAAIKLAIKQYGFKAFMVGIRWDEHDSRAGENYFSPRETHDRVHPILHFTEKDIWDYIKQNKVPYVPLYDKGYRSLGEAPFTRPAKDGEGERSGRERDKELLMRQLRDLGYW